MAEEHEAIGIWGNLKPHDGVTLEYDIEWYKRQGFEIKVKGDEPYLYLPLRGR
jgi:hypothetical protein